MNWQTVQRGRISPPREGINVLDESCIGEEIPLLAEEGWTRHEENVPLPIWRGRGGQFGEIFRPEHFAELLLRLRAIALALRATRLRRCGGFATSY